LLIALTTALETDVSVISAAPSATCLTRSTSRHSAQAEAVAALVATYLTHLPFEAEQLRMLPKELVTEAAPLFVKTDTSRNS
jgi:hypothetical protein